MGRKAYLISQIIFSILFVVVIFFFLNFPAQADSIKAQAESKRLFENVNSACGFNAGIFEAKIPAIL